MIEWEKIFTMTKTDKVIYNQNIPGAPINQLGEKKVSPVGKRRENPKIHEACEEILKCSSHQRHSNLSHNKKSI